VKSKTKSQKKRLAEERKNIVSRERNDGPSDEKAQK